MPSVVVGSTFNGIDGLFISISKLLSLKIQCTVNTNEYTFFILLYNIWEIITMSNHKKGDLHCGES